MLIFRFNYTFRQLALLFSIEKKITRFENESKLEDLCGIAVTEIL